LEGLKEGNHTEDLCMDRRIILKWISNKSVRVYTGFIRLRIGTSGCLVNMVIKFLVP
jgi:hypothetical protein